MVIETQNNFRGAWPVRVITLGGKTKAELRERLRQASVELNKYAEELFASGLFVVSLARYSLNIVETSVAGLGFTQGATMGEIHGRAGSLGLGLCPLELGPCLRLEYLDQPEVDLAQRARPAQAPAGAATIMSAALVEDDEFPKGFYLRRTAGVLWLRGYRSGPDHVWSSDDRLVFVRV